MLPLAVARPASVRLVDEAVLGSRVIGVVTQRDSGQETPAGHELHTVGTVGVIHRMLKQGDGTATLVLPRQNAKALVEDVPADVRAALTVHLVSTVEEALRVAFRDVGARRVSREPALAGCAAN